MYKIKYYLWLIGLVMCFSANAYSTNNTNTHTMVSTESLNNTDPCDGLIPGNDDDGDGIINSDECDNGTDPTDACDPPNLLVNNDCDGDGFSNISELTGTCKSNPHDSCDPPGQNIGVDCDGDLLTNSQEIAAGTDTSDPCDPPGQSADVDCDGDGLTNKEENTGIDDESTLAIPDDTSDPTDPCSPTPEIGDCDGDGLTYEEETTGTDDENTIANPNGNTSSPTNRCSPAITNNDSNPNNPEITINSENCLYGFNVCALDEANDSNCGYGKASVWYKFQVTTPGYYEIKTNYASFNHVLTLFDPNMSEIACTNDGKFSFREHLYEQLSTTGYYYVMVTGVEDITEGVFCIEVNTINGQIPTNQDCSGATPIELNTECQTGNNRYASYAHPLPLCNPYAGASVWYTFEVPLSGVDKVQISAAVNYSEVISLYKGTGCNDLTEIACKLNGTDYNDDLIISGLSSETIYYVQISGNFTSIEADNADCNEGSITISTNPDCEALCEQPCNDYNPNTINDVWDERCNCAGECIYAGDRCDDGDPNTVDDTFDGACNCVECIENEPCDDGNPNIIGEAWDGNCNCIGGTCQLTTVADCPNSEYIITDNCMCKCLKKGTSCDDGDTNTENDVWTAGCECLGTPIGTGSDCDSEIELTSSDVSGLYESSDWITNLGALAVNGSLELRAGDYIHLQPGFSSTGPTTYFNGRIEECTPIEERTEEETLLASVKHYPNPFKDEINLEFTLDFDAEVQIIISDVNGRMITHLPAQNLYTGTQTVNVSTEHWIAGVYFYQALIKQQNIGILTRATGTVVKM